IEKVAIVTTSSGLSNGQKNKVQNNLHLLGGTLLSTWDSTCTYLTIQEIILTMKVLLALIDDRPIVKLEYWDKLVENVKAKLPPPNIEDFRPPIAETLVDPSSLVVKPERKVLFAGKIFVFPTSKIKSKMDELVDKTGNTGGTSISWDKQPLSLLQVSNIKNNYLFVETDEVKQKPQSLKDMHQHLIKLGQRTIPIQEIALAVLTCSCEKNCNPNFNRIENVFMMRETDSHSEVFPLVSETQTQESEGQLKEEIIIPESLDEKMSIPAKPIVVSNTLPKQPLSVVNVGASTSTNFSTPKRISEEPQENPFKKMKLESVSKINDPQPVTSESKKRKAEENLGSLSKKSSLRENPFASLRNKNIIKKTAPDNPYMALRVKKELNSAEDNPVIKVIDKSSEESSVEKVEIKTPIFVDVESSPSYLNETRNSNTSNQWISKSSCKTEHCVAIDVEDELKDIFNLFKNTVVIESFPVVPRSINVRPVRPQISIINVTVPLPMNANTNEIIMLSDGEEEEERSRTSFKKVKSKRFDFKI
ncbi:nibrin, partial [Asbolus verrucosus]